MLHLNQTMLIRLRAVFVFIVLLAGNWPTLLHADQPEQTLPSASSFLLVASKDMGDPRFRQAVLVVTSHGDTGPIGVIVNRPETVTLDKIFPAHPAAKKLNLYFGGPAYPRQISYLVRGGGKAPNVLTVSSDVYLAYDIPTLGELLDGKRPYKDLRVMHGLASWAPGQLEYEIKIGGWYVMPLDEAVIFDHPAGGMWQELYNRANSIVL